MAVAKSFQNMEIVEGPYTQNGREYVKVKNAKTGNIRQVRWYSDQEYRKMYPDEAGSSTAKFVVQSSASKGKVFKTQKIALGFEKGYITIFKGDTYASLSWFQQSIARYTRWWGWYIMSTDEIPEDLPESITPVQLPWEMVGTEDEVLKPESAVTAAVDSLIYEPGVSEYMGKIGERLDLIVKVVRTFELENNFGHSTLHIMEDENKNVYVWTTASKNWTVGTEKHIRGTVKDHSIYRNTKQTVLTRCMEVK